MVACKQKLKFTAFFVIVAVFVLLMRSQWTSIGLNTINNLFATNISYFGSQHEQQVNEKNSVFSAPAFPLEDVDKKFGSTFWRGLFPDLKELLEKIENSQIEWPLPVSNTTDPKSTTLTIQLAKYKRGDEVRGFIQARSFTGKNKTYGGDHFRARLIRLDGSGKETSDSVSCIIVYNKETNLYELRTIVPWIGKSKFVIELVHSSEAIVDLVERVATLSNKINVAQYKSANGDRHDCDVKLRDYEGPVCNYSSRENGVSWYCANPKNATCPNDVINVGRRRTSSFTLGKHPLFRSGVNWFVEIKGSGTVIVSSEDINSNAELPKCKDAISGRQHLPTGFYSENKWTSLMCDNAIKDLSKAKKCLVDKTVHLFGDSTMRQWYVDALVKPLGLTDVFSPLAKTSWSMPRFGKDITGTTKLYFKAHANNLNNPGPPESHPSIVESLNNISTTNTIVVFNFGAHFLIYDPLCMLQRATAVKAAVKRLKLRLPDVQIFLRGNSRFSKSWPGVLTEWYYLRADLILRRVFQDLSYVRVIDSWEMTTCHPQNDLHPNVRTVADIVSYFLSNIC